LAGTVLHKETLKAELRIRYGSLRAFEEKRSLTPDSVRDVLRGRASRHAEVAIAEELGRPIHELFPNRYRAPEAGDSSTKRDDSARKRDAHRLSAGAV
jgi:lambda repressor-like predicted transcriptional regulator